MNSIIELKGNHEKNFVNVFVCWALFIFGHFGNYSPKNYYADGSPRLPIPPLFKSLLYKVLQDSAAVLRMTLSFQKSLNDVFCDSLAICQLWIYKGACLLIINV